VRAIVNRKSSGGRVYHWLGGPGRTLCGRNPADLEVVAELELDRLPAVEGCRGCVRTADGWTPDAPGSSGYLGEARVTAAPAAGRMRTTGPLAHGTRSRGSRRLG
jgi:hypothetical protein